MVEVKKLKKMLIEGYYDSELKKVYPGEKEFVKSKERLAALLDVFVGLYGDERDIELFSAPGRTEVGGNHTDHNHGRVLAAAISLDAIAAVSKNEDGIIRIKSDKYEKADIVKTDNLQVQPGETTSTMALIRGVCAGFVNRGYKIGGFDAATLSDVLQGSGLSSSASYEVLIASILNHLFNEGKVSDVEIAQISQFAENEFFGKPCGLMDQMACSVGGFVTIDFKDPENPVIEKINFDFDNSGHSLCIVDTKGDHAGLTEEYAAVRLEMEAVAKYFGKNNLREIAKEELETAGAELRVAVGDRAILRAYHFFGENEKVLKLVSALKTDDFEGFKALITESGFSSYMYNQNVLNPNSTKDQALALALCLSEQVLRGKGAWRVHGGGFAGTIQAFVPNALLEEYIDRLDKAFGQGSCHVLSIRPLGGTKIL